MSIQHHQRGRGDGDPKPAGRFSRSRPKVRAARLSSGYGNEDADGEEVGDEDHVAI